jgi:KDO2-lipid IV(A) lauroyltransferase
MSTAEPAASRSRGELKRCAAWLLYAWMRTIVLLPLRWRLGLGKALGTLVGILLPARRRVAERNLEVCFPELGPQQRQELLKKHLQSAGAGLTETAMGWFGSKPAIRRLVRVEGEEHLRRALAKGRGVILFSGHFTAIELFFPVLELLCPRLSGMYKPPHNAFMDEVARKGRQRNVPELFPTSGVRMMLKSLAQNAVVWYASDQRYTGKYSALVPFFGEPAMTNTAVSRIARISGAVVLPFFGRRNADDSGYVMTIGAPVAGVPSGDRIEDTRRLTRALEDYVRICPDQYWWVHERFKGRPEPYADIYERAAAGRPA